MLLCAVKPSSSSPKLRNHFVALLEKHPSLATKVRGLSCVARCNFLRQHKLATPLGTRGTPSASNLLGDKKNKGNIHSDKMTTDPNNNSDISPDNIIPATMEDLSEEDQLEIERVLGE